MTDPVDPYGGQPYQAYQGYPPYPPPSGHYPGYSPYAGYPGYPPPPSGPGRPSSVTAAAVLAFVAGGLLILTGLILVLGASVTNTVSDDFHHDLHWLSAELAVDAAVNFVMSALLIMGGVLLLGGKPNGRLLTWIGAALVVADSVYWIVRPPGPGGTLFPALVFAALAITAASLLSGPSARNWLTAN